MAVVQFRNDPKGINITKPMFPPKKVSEMSAWYKAARKVIPDIPDLEQRTWTLAHALADLQWVKFELRNAIGERAYVIIDRKRPAIGFA